MVVQGCVLVSGIQWEQKEEYERASAFAQHGSAVRRRQEGRDLTGAGLADVAEDVHRRWRAMVAPYGDQRLLLAALLLLLVRPHPLSSPPRYAPVRSLFPPVRRKRALPSESSRSSGP